MSQSYRWNAWHFFKVSVQFLLRIKPCILSFIMSLCRFFTFNSASFYFNLSSNFHRIFTKILLSLQLSPNKHLTKRLLRLYSFQIFFWLEFAVSIKIQSPDESLVIFEFDTFWKKSFEEVIETLNVDKTNRGIINTVVGGLRSVIHMALKSLFQIFGFFMHHYLHLKQSRHVLLHIKSQKVSRSAVTHHTLGGLRP